MSTFNGIIKEYPLISIDHFTPDYNFKSTVFFLSHCHKDHMEGLNTVEFFELLEKRCFSKIYVHEVSKHLLKNDKWYSKLSNYIVSLPLEEPQVIAVPDEKGGCHSKVVVTLLTAGHCPGSVMFLIEGHNGRILYTGDFRLPVGGAARLTKLKDEDGMLKPIDSLYIDTTFCQRDHLLFPPREKCLSSLFDLVEQWLKKGPNYIIAFSCHGQYNYEHLFVELFEKFKVKIHVSKDKLQKYKGIKIIEDVVTTVPTDTQIHACFYGKPEERLKEVHIDEEPCIDLNGKPCVHINRAPCGFHTPDRSFLKILIIKPCALSFRGCDGNEEPVYYCNKTRVHKICYSTHSSLTEIRDMVLYLKPKCLYPNVVQDQTEEEILDLIYEGASQNEESSDLSQPLLGTLKILKSDDSYSTPESLLFSDESYKNPPVNPCAVATTKSAAQQVEQLWSDSESSGKLERVKELIVECESEKKDNVNPSEETQVPNEGNANVLKWNCPLFSDDENVEPNSSFGCSLDKFEIISTLGNSQDVTPKSCSSQESKIFVKSKNLQKGKANKKVQTDDADDIVIPSVIQNKQPDIEVIDLSSDDSFNEISLMEGTSNLKKEKPDSRYVLNFNDNIKFEKLIPIESSEKIFINRLGNEATKRKSDESEYMFIKSLKRGTSEDHVHCYHDECIDSTPEDLFNQNA